MVSRLEEIRDYAEAELSNPDYNGPIHKESARRHARYCLELLERVSELEGELTRIERNNYVYRVMDERIKELEAENERLRGHFEVEGEGLRCNVCGRWDGFNEL